MAAAIVLTFVPANMKTLLKFLFTALGLDINEYSRLISYSFTFTDFCGQNAVFGMKVTINFAMITVIKMMMIMFGKIHVKL